MMATPRAQSLSSSLLLLLLLPLASAQCFFLDGSQVTQPDFVPCNATPGAVSMCCGLNRSSGQSSGGLLGSGLTPQTVPDVCLPNGLCQSLVVDNQGNQQLQFVRESCSRSDWVGCLKSVCPRVTASDIAMTACASTNQTTQWCCGVGNAACCALWPNHPDAAAIPLSFVGGQATSGSVQSATGAPTTFSTAVSGVSSAPADPTDPGSPYSYPTESYTDDPSTATATSTDIPAQGANGEVANQASGGLSSQAIAGVAAGVVVVVVILVTVGCFTAESLYKKRNRILGRKESLKSKIRLGRESPYVL